MLKSVILQTHYWDITVHVTLETDLYTYKFLVRLQ